MRNDISYELKIVKTPNKIQKKKIIIKWETGFKLDVTSNIIIM